MMNRSSYEEYQKDKQIEHEAECRRCGECCGSRDGDPCAYLALDNNRRFYCTVYQDRLGPRLTVSGRPFNCVSIRELIRQGTLRQGCAYRRSITWNF